MNRILISGTALHDGYNLIMFEFDKGDHANNVYIYGYPAYEPSRMIVWCLLNRMCVHSLFPSCGSFSCSEWS